MNPDRAARLRTIFDAAAERPPAERHAFVAAQCPDDPLLAAEVSSLLRALDGAGDFLDAEATVALDLAPPASPLAADVAPDLSGVRVGSFTLVKLIGRGGSGSVYEARQDSPSRSVALKLLTAWDVTREGRRRFVEEANILARLQHPGIAQVFAAGTHPLTPTSAVSWIAMELVEDARTLTGHADAAKLDLAGRINLFLPICDAVHHGHARGVIHRDLKPHNIVVGPTGVPKVIDFGVARAVGDATLRDPSDPRTVEGALIGTLRYMSPEQCEGQPQSADTRTDVYALGVILYELVTGTAPYALDTLTLSAAARVVCESPPIPPRRVVPRIPSDLETILLKALEKAPARRYQTVFEFAADLRRFLAREPIQARPTTALYRIATFARRRPAVMGFAVLALIGILAGLVGISAGLARERIARREADLRRDQAERQAWLANLFAADSALTRGDGGSAARRLEMIPPERRGWEWRYLSGRSDSALQRWQVLQEPAGLYTSPRGDLLACQLVGERLQVIDMASRAVRFSLAGVPKGSPFRWSADQRFVATPGIGRVAIVDVGAGKIVRDVVLADKDFALGAGWSPDGKLVAVGLSVNGLYIIDAASGKIVDRVAATGWIYDADFSPDGRTLAWDDFEGIGLYDLASRTTRHIPLPRERLQDFSTLRYSPDGKHVVAACRNFAVVASPDGTEPPIYLRGHAQRIVSAEFDPSGRHVVTASLDRTLKVWDLDHPEDPVTLLGQDVAANVVRFLPPRPGDPNGLLVLSADERATFRWWAPYASGSIYHASVGGSRSFVSQLDFDPSGTRLSCMVDDAVILWNLKGRPSVDRTLVTPHGCQRASPDLPYAAAGFADDRVGVFSLDSGVTRWTRPMGAPVMRLDYSSDGHCLAVVAVGKPISVLNAADGTEIARVDLPAGAAIDLVQFSPDGTLLLTREAYGGCSLWDAATGRLHAQLCPTSNANVAAAFFPDGKRIAFSDHLFGLAIWDVAAGRVVSRLPDLDTNVWSVAISPDQRRIAIGAQDRVVRILDLATYDELLQLRDHTGSVMSLKWSPDGRYLATGGYDQKVMLYDAAP